MLALALAVADVDRDGRLDAVIANHDGLPDLLDVSPTLDTLEVLSATCLSDRR